MCNLSEFIRKRGHKNWLQRRFAIIREIEMVCCNMKDVIMKANINVLYNE